MIVLVILLVCAALALVMFDVRRGARRPPKVTPERPSPRTSRAVKSGGARKDARKRSR